MQLENTKPQNYSDITINVHYLGKEMRASSTPTQIIEVEMIFVPSQDKQNNMA